MAPGLHTPPDPQPRVLLSQVHEPWLTPTPVRTAPMIQSSFGGMCGSTHSSRQGSQSLESPLVALLEVKGRSGFSQSLELLEQLPGTQVRKYTMGHMVSAWRGLAAPLSPPLWELAPRLVLPAWTRGESEKRKNPRSSTSPLPSASPQRSVWDGES